MKAEELKRRLKNVPDGAQITVRLMVRRRSLDGVLEGKSRVVEIAMLDAGTSTLAQIEVLP